MPPEEPIPYDATRALREMWDPALLEAENDPPRRTVILSSASPARHSPLGRFVRQEPGERVLIDAAGPGVLTRFTSADGRGSYRFHVDDDAAPAWDCEAWRLFTPGRSPVMPEFIARAGWGGTVHVPIPFARSLRVTAIDGAGDRWLATVSFFAPDQEVTPWTPMSREQPPGFSEELEKARRWWRGEEASFRDGLLATLAPGDAWTAAEDTLVTALGSEAPSGTVEVPTSEGARRLPAAALLTGRGSHPRFDVPFLVAKGESIRAECALLIHGRTVEDRVARSAPRLAISMEEATESAGAITGVGRVLRLWWRGPALPRDLPWELTVDPNLHAGGHNAIPSLLDLAGGSPEATPGITTGTLALSISIPSKERPEAILRSDFPSGGMSFAAGVSPATLGDDCPNAGTAWLIGQVFPGPPAQFTDVGAAAVADARRTGAIPGVLDAGLPRVLNSEYAYLGPSVPDPRSPIENLLSQARDADRGHRTLHDPGDMLGPEVLTWTPDGGAGTSEMRKEDDGSVVLEVPPDFVPRAGDVLIFRTDESTEMKPQGGQVLATFEPHSGNEGAPVFPARFARRRGTNGIVTAPFPAPGSGHCFVPIGNNASWPGGRRDRIVLRAESCGAAVPLHPVAASLHRAEAAGNPQGARWVPLRWDARERVFGMYPEAQVELRGQALYDALSPRAWLSASQLFPEWIPQVRLEHLAAAPFGPRVSLPVDPGPQPDEEPAMVFTASAAGESMELRHPALNGATALAIRLGNSPDAARVAVRDAALRVVACEDLFLNERRLPGRVLVINLPEPNPGDFITFEAQGPAPSSSSCTMIVERVLIGGPPGLRNAQAVLPCKPSRVLSPEPPRRPF